MYNMIYNFSFLLIIFASGILFSQTAEKPVARVGHREITLSEFIERYEMTPWNKEIRMTPEKSAKEEFLYTLIAEKLWSQKASDLGLDTSAAVKRNLKSLEKLFVKDALYRLEIMNKVNITDGDMAKVYKKAHLRLNGEFLAASGSKEINDLYKELQKGASFDKLFKEKKDEGLADTLSIFLGKFNESLEDSLYNMEPGNYSHPVLYGGAWYIIRVKNQNPVNPRSAKDEDLIVKETRKILKERETNKYYTQFMRNYFSGKKTSINGSALQSVARYFIETVQEKFRSRKNGDTSKLYLGAADFSSVRKKLEAEKLLNTPIIKFEKQSSSVSEFLDYLNYDENVYTTSNSLKLKGIIERKLKNFMEGEYLADEGYRRGLQNLPEVKNQMQIWKDSYMFLALKTAVSDSFKVSEKEVEEYYSKQKTLSLPPEVNIVEVLTDNLDIIEKVLDEYGKGTDMHELARKYSKREMTRNTGGEFGWFSSAEFGEIGRIAATLNIGEVYGPLKVPEGYSVFKVIDKKDQSAIQARPFQEVKDQVTKTLRGLKNYHGLVNYTVKLAREYGIKIDQDVLNSATVTNIFSIMYRNIGFGGRILAVPMTSPYTEWVTPWQNSKGDNL
ncbi:MAG: peptidyl-prolyl cis-trans isomerase [Syntrophothermus sp.]